MESKLVRDFSPHFAQCADEMIFPQKCSVSRTSFGLPVVGSYISSSATSPTPPLSSVPLYIRIRNPRPESSRYRKPFTGFLTPRFSKLPRIDPGKLVARKVEAMGSAERNNLHPFELKDAASFQNIATENGLISICGFGSLLSERSARLTFPNLLNFRVGVLHGFRRVFAHVAPVFLERGIANVETKEMSSLSAEPFPSESIVVTVFEISQSEVPAFIEREHEFRFLAVTVHNLEGGISTQKAVICSRYSDKEYRRDRCQGDEEYHKRYGRFNIQQIWRDDILPCRTYLRHCVLAAKTLGQAAYDSFLDHTYLGDRITCIRLHLEADGGIMQEEPPLALRERYGG